MPWTTQRLLVEAIAARPEDPLIGLDAVKELSPQSLGSFREICPRVGILFVSEDECPVEREDELWTLAGNGLDRIAHKRSDRGGFLFDLDRRDRQEWTPRPATVVDTTGAGDAFAGGVLAGRLLGDDWPRGPRARSGERQRP
jgi:sugar/nucleoside kinase (ribokinase family)